MTGLADLLSAGHTVVTATRRLSRYLRHVVDSRHAASGGAAWHAPDALPLGGFLERLWSQSAVAGGEAGGRRLIDDEQALLIWRQVVAASGRAPPADSAVLAALAQRSWQLALAWDINPTDLAAAADSPDSEAFAAWSQAYRERGRTEGWVDLPGVTAPIVRDLGASLLRVPRGACFAGFDPLPPQTARLAGALTGRGTALFEVPDAHAESAAHVVACDDAEQELELAARWARAALETGRAARVGIVVPDLARRAQAVRRTVLEVFAPGWQLDGDAAVSISYGQPLADYALANTGLLLARAATGSLSFAELSQILRSPYVPAADAEAAARAALELRVRDAHVGECVDLGAALVHARRVAPAVAACLEPDPGAAEQRLPAAWAARLDARLHRLGFPGRALDSMEFQVLKAWHAALEGLARLDGFVGPVRASLAVALLEDICRSRVFEPVGSEQGLQVLGVLEAEGQCFDALWVCGLSADQWPQPAAPAPLIATGLQIRRGMPSTTPQHARELSERQLSRLRRAAPRVCLSWPRRRQDELLVASPLLAGLPGVEPDALDRHRTALSRERIALSSALETVQLDVPPPVRRPGNRRGGSRLLGCQAANPARAFAEYRLGASELRAPLELPDARLRGLIVHAALDRLYADQPSPEGLAAEATPERLRACAAAAIERIFPAREPLLAALAGLEAETVMRLLGAVVDFDISRGGFRVLATEQSRMVELGGLTLALRLDRLEEGADGGRLVIDYKTGRVSVSGWRGPRPGDPQLPLYALSGEAQAIAFMEIGPQGVRLIGVGEGDALAQGLRAPGELAARPDAGWGELRAEWQRELEALASEFLAGDFRVPDPDPEAAGGQFPMLTRSHELGQPAADEPG